MVFLSFPRLKVYCPQHSSCGKHWPPEAGILVAAIASGLPALLCGAEAVDKSWPAFWSVLRGLGAKVELNTDKQEEFDIKA